jgi:hypothetical protein
MTLYEFYGTIKRFLFLTLNFSHDIKDKIVHIVINKKILKLISKEFLVQIFVV